MEYAEYGVCSIWRMQYIEYAEYSVCSRCRI
jgi:hypothetical protein